MFQSTLNHKPDEEYFT